MRLPVRSIMDIQELEATRPGKGEIVVFDNERYVIEQVGHKYFVVHAVDNPASLRWLKHSQVIRWTPPDPSEMEDHEMKIPLIKRRD